MSAIGHIIYYARAFIRAGSQYVPLVNSGDSNSANIVNGRTVADKGWEVLNWRRRGRALFSEAKIRGIARDYEQHSAENRMSYTSRNTPFAPGEFERWILGGMKRARTVEEYCSFGNSFFVTAAPAPGSGETRWSKHPFSTTEEMLDVIGRLGKLPEIHISLANSRELYLPGRQQTASRDGGSVVGTLRSWRAQHSPPKTQAATHKSIGGNER